MNYIERLQSEIKKGFTKTYLEKQIGLPKNSLASYISGKKKMTAANEARVVKFLTKNPELDILSMPRRTRTNNFEREAERLRLEAEMRSNPFINAARGRDASGINEDEIRKPQNKPIAAPKKEKQINTPQKPKEVKSEQPDAPRREDFESDWEYKLAFGVWKREKRLNA